MLHKLRLLWNDLHTDIEIVVVAYDAQHEVEGMDIVLVFRISAQIVVKIALKRVGQTVEVSAPLAVFGRESAKVVLAKVTEVVSDAVALLVLILEVVAELQIRSLEDWLAIGKTS